MYRPLAAIGHPESCGWRGPAALSVWGWIGPKAPAVLGVGRGPVASVRGRSGPGLDGEELETATSTPYGFFWEKALFPLFSGLTSPTVNKRAVATPAVTPALHGARIRAVGASAAAPCSSVNHPLPRGFGFGLEASGSWQSPSLAAFGAGCSRVAGLCGDSLVLPFPLIVNRRGAKSVCSGIGRGWGRAGGLPSWCSGIRPGALGATGSFSFPQTKPKPAPFTRPRDGKPPAAPGPPRPRVAFPPRRPHVTPGGAATRWRSDGKLGQSRAAPPPRRRPPRIGGRAGQ